MAALLFAIVEARVKGKDKAEKPRTTFNRTIKALQALHGRTLQGHRIDALITDPLYAELRDPCIVPDFGHNHACKCKHPEKYGVLRLFGLTLCVEGNPELSIMATYAVGEDIQMVISGCSRPSGRQGKPVEVLERF